MEKTADKKKTKTTTKTAHADKTGGNGPHHPDADHDAARDTTQAARAPTETEPSREEKTAVKDEKHATRTMKMDMEAMMNNIKKHRKTSKLIDRCFSMLVGHGVGQGVWGY